ncbi:MAG: hypothetical protein E6Q97_14185 [Desulfurellales bacterium]|nr:MAG: hypothetical protein E6Q97_14185 [Desulfurellales bacterium]
MSSSATAAVFNLAQELTAEEFRLLMLISEISGEYAGWLVVDPLRTLSRSRLTARQMGRMLYALHCNRVIELGAESPAQQPLTVERLCQDLALDTPLHLFVWITGMPEAETMEPEPTE